MTEKKKPDSSMSILTGDVNNRTLRKLLEAMHELGVGRFSQVGCTSAKEAKYAVYIVTDPDELVAFEVLSKKLNGKRNAEDAAGLLRKLQS